MKKIKMKCEVIDVRTDSNTCPGEAQTVIGEEMCLVQEPRKQTQYVPMH